MGMTYHGAQFLSTCETRKQVITSKEQRQDKHRIKVMDFVIPKGRKWQEEISHQMISESNRSNSIVVVQSLSHVRFFATLRTVACQALLSMEISRQEYWSGLPFPSPGYLPNPGIKPTSPAFAGRLFTAQPPGKAQISSDLGILWSMTLPSEPEAPPSKSFILFLERQHMFADEQSYQPVSCLLDFRSPLAFPYSVSPNWLYFC